MDWCHICNKSVSKCSCARGGTNVMAQLLVAFLLANTRQAMRGKPMPPELKLDYPDAIDAVSHDVVVPKGMFLPSGC